MCEFMSFMQIWLQMNYRLYIIYYRVSLEKAGIGIPYCMWKIKLMIILIKYEVPSKIEQGRGKMKKIISNLSVVIFVDSVKWPMKKRAKEKSLKWTLKTVDILCCGSLPPPLTARKRTAVGESPTAKNSRTVWIFRRLQQCSSSFSCHQGQAALRWLG